MKNFLIVSIIILFSLVFFDISTYHFIPDERAAKFWRYKKPIPLYNRFGGRGGYPQYYYISNNQRGFDIATNRKDNKHYIQKDFINTIEYDIWSNSLGCFDIEHKNLSNYIYLAGDSYAWGYTPFENKFGTILEASLSIPIIKCGVSHTGQKHQLSKAKEVIAKIGIPPKIILVLWTQNDPANDHFHPHSTVIDGWQVNKVVLNNNDEQVIVEDSILRNKIKQVISKKDRKLAKLVKEGHTFKGFLRKYSIISHIVNKTLYLFKAKNEKISNLQRPNPENLKSIYLHSAMEYSNLKIYPYNNIYTQKNKEALMNFKIYADSMGSKLIVILESRGQNQLSEVLHYLKGSGITYYDLGSYQDLNKPGLRWQLDGHWNKEGNTVVATLLHKILKDYKKEIPF